MTVDVGAQVGARLAAARRSARWSRGAVAERIGSTKAAVGCWERGDRPLTVQRLAQICEVIGVRVDEMFEAPAVPCCRACGRPQPVVDESPRI